MSAPEYVIEQYQALRREIDNRQSRGFWTIVIGLIGGPLLMYFGLGGGGLLLTLLPFFVVVVMVTFLTEQNAMMRAGRYIREELEPKMGADGGWEKWLESKVEYRLVERHSFACFLLIYLLFYFVSIGVAMNKTLEFNEMNASNAYLQYGLMGSYLISTIWIAYVIVHFWKSSVSTANS